MALAPDFVQILTLIFVLAGGYVVVMGAVSLVMGWHLFSDRKLPRYRRGAAVLPGDGTGPDAGTVW